MERVQLLQEGIWMDSNLGTSRVAKSTINTSTYRESQWRRKKIRVAGRYNPSEQTYRFTIICLMFVLVMTGYFCRCI